MNPVIPHDIMSDNGLKQVNPVKYDIALESVLLFMISQLQKMNQLLRQNRPNDSLSGHCSFFLQGDLLEISVPSFRCRHDAEGSCIMCNYGHTDLMPPRKQLELECEHILSDNQGRFQKLFLCTNGSFLDDWNVPVSLQKFLIRKAQESDAPLIIIETHPDTITPQKLSMLRSFIPQKQILLELGLESSDTYVQNECYLKNIPRELLENALHLGKNAGFCFQLNVMLGAPFLTASEQFKDAENTLRWVLGHKAAAALFPMNIKPFTLLKKAYENGIYSPVSHWMVPLLLQKFSPDELGLIDLAWYGNRQIEYASSAQTTIFPADCPLCHQLLQDFYRSYVCTDDGEVRYQLVKSVLYAGGRHCDCLQETQSALALPIPENRKLRVGSLQKKLLNVCESRGF